LDPAWSFIDLVDAIDGGVKEGKSDKRSSTDVELGLLFLLPTFLVKLVVRAMMALDELGFLPRAVIDADPMYASLFVANLGSIGMQSAFHHLYEYGNIPIFATIGRAEEGVMTIRYSFDERVEDGLYCLRALELLREVLLEPQRFARVDAATVSVATLAPP
jgi:hypothetical protein